MLQTCWASRCPTSLFPRVVTNLDWYYSSGASAAKFSATMDEVAFNVSAKAFTSGRWQVVASIRSLYNASTPLAGTHSGSNRWTASVAQIVYKDKWCQMLVWEVFGGRPGAVPNTKKLTGLPQKKFVFGPRVVPDFGTNLGPTASPPEDPHIGKRFMDTFRSHFLEP